MGHGLTNTDWMFSVREVPWHGIGSVIEEAPDMWSAMAIGKLNWKVSRCKVYAKSSDDDDLILTDRDGLYREDTKEILGVVSKRYNILQNEDMFSFADCLIGDSVKYETAGSLFGGKQVFATAKWQKEWSVGDDSIRLYLLLSNCHNGLGQFKVAVTPVRVVCNNTLQFALRSTVRDYSIKHFTNILSRVDEAKATLRISSKYMTDFVEFGNRLTEKRLTPEAVEHFVDKLFDRTEGMSKRSRTMFDFKVNNFEKCYDRDDLKSYRNTPWALVNAVSDYATHGGRKQTSVLKDVLASNLGLFDKALDIVQSL